MSLPIYRRLNSELQFETFFSFLWEGMHPHWPILPCDLSLSLSPTNQPCRRISAPPPDASFHPPLKSPIPGWALGFLLAWKCGSGSWLAELLVGFRLDYSCCCTCPSAWVKLMGFNCLYFLSTATPSLYLFNTQLLNTLYDCKTFSPLPAIKKNLKMRNCIAVF